MKITCTTIDADDVATLAGFWSAALGRPLEGDPSEGYVFLGSEGEPGRICVQRTDDAKTGKNRMHFDLEATDRAAEVTRLVGLGATHHADHDSWTVLRDVEGNQFCVF